MRFLNRSIHHAKVRECFTHRKGQLDVVLDLDKKAYLLSWTRQGNRAFINFSARFSVPRQRVHIFRSLKPDAQIYGIFIHSNDRLLRIGFDSGEDLILGGYPGALNVYHRNKSLEVIDQFLKDNELPSITESWLTSDSSLPATLPGNTLSAAQLLACDRGMVWAENLSDCIAESVPSEKTIDIADLTRNLRRTGSRAKRETTTSTAKTARVVLKRWRAKLRKMEQELDEAQSWPDLEKELRNLEIAMGLGLSPESGEIEIPPEFVIDGTPRKISVDSAISLQTAVEKQARRIRKFKSKVKQLQPLLKEIRKELFDLVSLMETQEEAALLNFLQSKGELLDNSGHRIKERKPYKSYTSPSGFDILVGRSASDNDTLSFKVAGKQDWWFHARQAHGSHVILRTGSQTPKHEDILRAAEYAALNSKAKHSGIVVVQYCQRKHLSKPKGASAGRVHVHQEKTITLDLSNRNSTLS